MKLSESVKNLPGYLVSDGEFRCLAFATEQVQTEFLTFLDREKFLPSLRKPGISCVLTTPELAEQVPAHVQGVFICERPKAALFEIHNYLAGCDDYVGPSFPTKVGNDCQISPLAVIDNENIVIGDRVIIEPFAVIKGRVTVGNDAVIRAGAVVGCKGFSFSKDGEGRNIFVADTAQIILEDQVELFEEVVISTGIFHWEKTVIDTNTRVDAQCHIGHGAHIGRNCLIAEGGKCCGNSWIGDHVWVGVAAVISNRVRVGCGARVSIGSVVTKDVPPGETVTGNFAIPHQVFMRNLKNSLQSTDKRQMFPWGGQPEFFFPALDLQREAA